MLLLLALAGAAVAYLALSRGGEVDDDPGRSSPRPMTQEQIDAELGELQQSFQTALQEKLDLSRLAGQARVFTEAHPNEPGGHVLLAGLLTEQEAKVRRAYRKASFRLAKRLVNGDWSILWLRKRRRL